MIGEQTFTSTNDRICSCVCIDIKTDQCNNANSNFIDIYSFAYKAISFGFCFYFKYRQKITRNVVCLFDDIILPHASYFICGN